jgi:DNA-binding MltR family transcriptional regulator
VDLDPRALAHTVVGETHRGAIILLGSLVEDVIQEQLEKRFRPLNSHDHDRLFGPEKPLGSFSAKARVAFALQIIDREDFTFIEMLREMRNICAHSQRDISFRNEELRDVLASMLRPMAAVKPELTEANCVPNPQ